jgi:class 3 adenylate cyclase
MGNAIGEGFGPSTATVLFTDLVGSTETRSTLGDEAADELRRRHDRLITTAVEANRGRVVKGLGDGVMAVFAGAADAVAAAVAIQQAFDRLNRASGGRFEVRIGLSAGDVSFEDGDCFGTPVVEAARLCATSQGGQILAAEVVRVLAGSRGRQRFGPLVPLALKGLPEQVPAVEVDWAPEVRSGVPLPVGLDRSDAPPFVGRTTERETLDRAWKEAGTGERRVVLVAGEPGIGKSRLVAELARAVHEAGAVVLYGRCEEELGLPYQPFAEAVADYVATCSPEELRAQLGSLGGELSRLVPTLPGRLPGLAPPLAADADTERYRLFEAIRDLMAGIAESGTVLLVLDDLQWAARPTLLLLHHLVRRSEGVRLLVTGTFRDTDLGATDPLGQALADLRRLSGVERLSLSGLDEAGVVAIMEALAGHEVDKEILALAGAIQAETEGNPFFIGEVLRHLVESEALAVREGRWRMLRPLPELGIPEGVREVVGRRLGRLPPMANDVLAVAAVIGRQFDLDLLTEVADLDSDAVLDTLEEAERARLVVARPERAGRYGFAHALVRSTLCESLPRARLLRLHRRIGLALEARPDTPRAELAHHFIEAAPIGEVDRAVLYARQAGDRARAGLAFEEAATHYERGLAALELGVSPDPGLRCDLQIALGDALHRAGDRRYRDVLAAGAASARILADPRRLAEVVTALNLMGFARPLGVVHKNVVALAEDALAGLPERDDPLRARLLSVLAVELTWAPELDRRLALSWEALRMARRLGDLPTLARVLASHQFAAHDPLNVQDRLEAASELVDLGRELGDTEATLQGHLWRYAGLVELGAIDDADADLDAAELVAGQLRHPAIDWQVAYHRAGQALLAGRLEDTEHLVWAAYQLGLDGGVPQGALAAVFRPQLQQLRYDQGRLIEALEAVDVGSSVPATAVPAWHAHFAHSHWKAGNVIPARLVLQRLTVKELADFPRDMFWLGGLTALAWMAAGVGDVVRATSLYRELAPCSGRFAWSGSYSDGPVDLALGLLATTLGHFEDAERHFAAAGELCRRARALSWLARTRCEWSLMLLLRDAPGDTARARQLAEEASSAAEDLGMPRVAEQARVLAGG